MRRGDEAPLSEANGWEDWSRRRFASHLSSSRRLCCALLPAPNDEAVRYVVYRWAEACSVDRLLPHELESHDRRLGAGSFPCARPVSAMVESSFTSSSLARVVATSDRSRIAFRRLECSTTSPYSSQAAPARSASNTCERCSSA